MTERAALPSALEEAAGAIEDFRARLGLDVRAWHVSESGREPLAASADGARSPQAGGPRQQSEHVRSFRVGTGARSLLEVEVACPDGRGETAGALEATLRRTCRLARVAGEHVSREMELAHELQQKLIPPIPRIDGVEACARVVPAASVGGDFYQVVAVSRERVGVMIGDVSGHGLPAALIMAHAISAAVISAEGGSSPAAVLERIHHAIGDELESTEMFVTLFYGVLSLDEPRLVYSNAGHAHAFLVPASGDPRRLPATEPPMGIAPPPFAEAAVPWRSGEDLLLLFTDGLSDTLASRHRSNGETRVVSAVARRRSEPPAAVLDRLFAMRGPTRSLLADDRTAVLVRTTRRSPAGLPAPNPAPPPADAAPSRPPP